MAWDKYTQGVNECAQHERAQSVGDCAGSGVMVHGMSERAQHT